MSVAPYHFANNDDLLEQVLMAVGDGRLAARRLRQTAEMFDR